MNKLDELTILWTKLSMIEDEICNLLQCKKGDAKAMTAELMMAEGKSINLVKRAGRQFCLQWKAGTADSTMLDTSQALKLFAEMRVDAPMKPKKGNRPSIIVK